MSTETSVSFEAFVEGLANPANPLAVSKLVDLSSLGPDEAPLFLNAWLEMDTPRRLLLIEELIDLAEDNVELNFDAVYLIALGDAEPDVRREAIRGLWEYEGRDLIDPLAALLQADPDAAVRAEAALALGRFVLRAEFGTLRDADADRIDGLLRSAAEDMAEIAEVRARALEAIGARGQPWVHDLIDRAFESPERRLRLSAVHAMGRSCDASWLPALVSELESDDPEMRFEAAGALGAIADEAAVPHLIALLHDDDVEVQEAAVGALGEIGGQQAKEALEELLSGADDRLREAVTSALAQTESAGDPLGFEIAT